MMLRVCLAKLGEAVQSFWDVLEAAYYGRFSLHQNGCSPSSQLFRVTIALSIAMTASILTSVIVLPLVLPVILSWCMVAPCSGRVARKIQSFFETAAAGSLIPFVCLYCTGVASFRVMRLLSHSTPKSVYRFYTKVERRIRKWFRNPQQADVIVDLPLYRTNAVTPFKNGVNTSHVGVTTPRSIPPPSKIALYRKRHSRAFRFLDLPPELRMAVYYQAFRPYRQLVCLPTRLLRANREFKNATSLLRTCRQIRYEASTYLFGRSTFYVFTRYPFYRNIDPQLTTHIRDMHVVTCSNSRGYNGLNRVLYWDLRRMRQLRRITISLRDTDLLRHGELIGNALRNLKQINCLNLVLVTIIVMFPPSISLQHGRHVKEQLLSWLDHAKVVWPSRSWTFAALDPLGKEGKRSICVGEVTQRSKRAAEWAKRYEPDTHKRLRRDWYSVSMG